MKFWIKKCQIRLQNKVLNFEIAACFENLSFLQRAPLDKLRQNLSKQNKTIITKNFSSNRKNKCLSDMKYLIL